MRRLIGGLLLAFPGLAFSQWELLPETTLADLYAVPETPYVDSVLKGFSTLTWPNGDQGIVTFIEISREGEKRLHKCIEVYTPQLEIEGASCYILVPDELDE